MGLILYSKRDQCIGLVVGHVLSDFRPLPQLYGCRYTSDIFYPSGYLRSLEITVDVSGCAGGCCLMCQTYSSLPTNKTQMMDSPFFGRVHRISTQLSLLDGYPGSYRLLDRSSFIKIFSSTDMTSGDRWEKRARIIFQSNDFKHYSYKEFWFLVRQNTWSQYVICRICDHNGLKTFSTRYTWISLRY